MAATGTIRTDVPVAPAVIHFLRAGGSHYVIVRADGSFYDRNDYGKPTGFACARWATAVGYARRKRDAFIVSLVADRPLVQEAR